MEANKEIQVELEWDWRKGMTRDFSLVVWSSSVEVEITAQFPETKASSAGWPLTPQIEDMDMNAASENPADSCYKNPA